MTPRIALITALLVLIVGTDSTLAASRVSGRLSNASYDLVLLGRNGRAQTVHADRSGRFSVRIASIKGATMHLLRRGRYAGPVVLRGSQPRVALAAAGTVRLGTIRVHAGYAMTSRRVAGSGRPVRTTAGGRPLGAGRLGLVAARRASVAQAHPVQAGPVGTEGADQDQDRVPNAFDADDDGDMKLDNIEGTESTGPRLSLSSALPVDITSTINANAGANADQNATLRQTLRLLFSVSADEVPGAQRVGVSCTFAWCPGAQIVLPASTPDDPGTPWTDLDGDGLADLPLNGPAFWRQIYPRATAADIKPGDTFTATTDQGTSMVSALSFYFTSSVAVKSIGDQPIAYPAGPDAAGAPGHPLKVPRLARITLWRPQRAAIPGAEPGTTMDIGGLHYGVGVDGGFCAPQDFTDLSETIHPGTGDNEAPLQDNAGDAPPTGATISFTVDTAACAAHGDGPAANAGLPMLGVVAKDASEDLSRQLIVVEFQ